jgi:hypothetical protein
VARGRSTTRASARRSWRDRHGRGIRASVAGPQLPPLRSRADAFEMAVASTVEYLKELWPDELADVTFEIAGMPAPPPRADVERWRVLRRERRVIMYRMPIERLAKLHRDDEPHRRMLVESCVFRAVGELLGKDPWDLAPDRFRHL